jgi:hypothetical protein
MSINPNLPKTPRMNTSNEFSKEKNLYFELPYQKDESFPAHAQHCNSPIDN